QYRFTEGDWQVSTRVFRSDVNHGMTNYHLRVPPVNPMQRRRSEATSDSEGFGLALAHGIPGDRWQIGIDSYLENHNALIDNPWNTAFWIEGFDDASRRVQGLFAEYEWHLGKRWSMDAGIRYNVVSMNADTVDSSMAAMMNMMGMRVRNLRDAFNAADRQQTDHNIDAVWRVYFQQTQALRWYAGLAQKTRSPSFQERYLWLPLEATGGLADGNTYTGNITLDPEIAHQFEAGFDWEGQRFTAAPRVFYSRIHDYIQGVPSTNADALALVAMMNMMNGTSNPPPLQYDNVGARLYGFDMPWAWTMTDHWRLQGSVSLVRGERRDISDDLYRITPDNLRAGLVYYRDRWSVTLEGVFVDAQTHVSATNREQESSGYALANLKSQWQVTERFTLSAQVENLFDRKYRDHLGGYNRAVNPDIALGERLPGNGRNLFVGMEYSW
ncbi:MAG: TonB-dependent receptor, partial [Gammaproteobacteria bacterium]